MTILDVLTIPNPVLLQPCTEVTEFDEGLVSFVNDLFETMVDQKGIGLAAPQVGILERICVCHTGKAQLILINPKITKTSGLFRSEEGCLSIPDVLYDVPRYQFVTVEYDTLEGERTSYEAKDLMAVVIQHEIDHLDGILINAIGNLIEKES